MDLQKRCINVLITMEVLLLVVVVVYGLFNYQNRYMADELVQIPQDSAANQNTQDDSWGKKEEEVEPEFSEAVVTLMQNMTLEEKVAQLFVITPEALTGAGQVTVARTMSQNAIRTYPVGGIVFARTNYMGNVQFQTLVNRYHDFSKEALGVELFTFAADSSESGMGQFMNMNLEECFIPASFEAATVEALRKEHGTQAVIVSGNLSDDVITGQYRNGEAEIAAVKAGVDLLYNPVNFKSAYTAVVEAVKNGTIEASVLEQAVGRILTEKLN